MATTVGSQHTVGPFPTLISMAEPSAANDAAQRYAAIENSYSKEDWATVLIEGEVLLRELEAEGLAPFLPLRMRLQLLLGHTHLYGYDAKEKAADLYGIVAHESNEPALARIAEQGLKQCAIPAAPEPAAVTTTPLEAPTAGGTPAVASGTTAAAPWLEATAVARSAEAAASAPDASTMPAMPSTATTGTAPAAPTPIEPEIPAEISAAPWTEESLIPDVVEEPELIELHQADPSLADEVVVAWKDRPSIPVDAEDEDLLSGLLLVRIS